MGTLMLGILASVVGSVIAWIISQEIQGWGPRVSESLVDRAVRRLPERLQDRYREEWYSHILDKPTPVSKLYAAAWLNLVAFRMSREFRASGAYTAPVIDFSLRVADLVLAFGALVTLSPIMLCIIAAMKVTDSGPVVFGHRRIGKDGREFRVFKFRTMRSDSAYVLQQHLQSNADARAEWEATGKLRSDPRITRLGRFLRETSLDELPSLFNILAGSMSMIGPRPIVPEEIPHFGRHFGDYTAVRPGVADPHQFWSRRRMTMRRRVAVVRLFRRKRSFRLYMLLLFSSIVVMFRKDIDR